MRNNVQHLISDYSVITNKDTNKDNVSDGNTFDKNKSYAGYNDWKVIYLKDITEKVKLKDPTKTPNFQFRYVDVSSISSSSLKIKDYSIYTGKNAPSRAKKLIKTDDIIFATIRPSLKRIAIIPSDFNEQICSTAFCVIRCKLNLAYPKFVFQAISTDKFVKNVASLQDGSGYPAVSDSDILNQRIKLPPINEQYKIAAILSTVDAAIEATENIIIQTEKIKNGLMNIIFSANQNNKIVQLGDYTYIKARIGWRGLNSSEYTKEGSYLIAGQHIVGTKIDWINCDHLSDYRYDESPEIQLKVGDVIISKDGTIGRVGYIGSLPGKATINGTMMLIRSNDTNVLLSKYLYYYFQSESFQKLVKERISGSSVPHIFQRDITKLKIPLTQLEIQRKAVNILSIIDDKIESERIIKSKLEILKKGLMRVLLTGQVRVKVDP